jgi:HEAT repeat protein
VSLGKIQRTENLAELRRWTHSRKSWVREYSAWRLGELGELTARGDLVRLLDDERSWVRLRAAEALGKLEDGSSVPALIRALETERDIDVQCAILRSLGDMPGPESQDVVSRFLDSPHLLVRGAAMSAHRRLE